MNKRIKKIAIVGPESTGKSTMSKQLAKHYNVPWVPEYARFYCDNLIEPCNLQDETNMFHGQRALEESVLSMTETDFIICDTTFLTVKIWSDEMFGMTPQVVLDGIKTHPYDLYLLLDIDLPWQDDPLRDFPTKREYFMEVWRKELKDLNANYTVISGTETRLQNAIIVIDEFLSA